MPPAPVTSTPSSAPSPSRISSLVEVPGLELLWEVCEKFDIEITAFGSIVRRLAFHLVRESGRPLPDLFQLAPFLSDIDLYHSGKPDQNNQIREAILRRVPYSECFRWEVTSEQDLQSFRDDAARLHLIPLNKLTLSVRAGNGIQDPFNAFEDITRKAFRLELNPFYQYSELKRQHRDCELLHASFFLQIIFEHDTEGSPKNHPGGTAYDALIEASKSTSAKIALGESAYLRSRLRYRRKSLISACRNQRQLDQIFEFGLVDQLPLDLPDLLLLPAGGFRPRAHGPLICSCRLGGDLYRFEEAFPSRIAYEGRDSWEYLPESTVPLKALSHSPIPQLAEGQRIVGASSRHKFIPGVAPSSRGNEHVHLQFALSDNDAAQCSQCEPSDLGVLAALIGVDSEEHLTASSHACVVALPSACAFRWFQQNGGPPLGLIQFRVNFGKILEVFPDLLNRAGLNKMAYYCVQFFIVDEYE